MPQLQLDKDIQEIARITALIEEYGRTQNWTTEIIFAFVLSLEEIFTNAISHGFPVNRNNDDGGVAAPEQTRSPPSPPHLCLQLDCDAGVAKAVFEDNGLPFNLLERAPVNVSAPLEERGVGGLGIFLVGKMMDSIQYARVRGVNYTTLQKKLPPPVPVKPSAA